MGAKTAAELAIEITTKADQATAGIGDVGEAARKAEQNIDGLSGAAEKSSRSLGLTADAADDMAGKTGKATGALGALSSGFELVGAEKYAGTLQSAAMATDFLSGAGDAMNLVMESSAGKFLAAKAQALAHGAATGFLAAKTAVMTAGQWALNVAMSANPIGLAIAAGIALAAGFVLLYKKSETFREGVQAVGRFGYEAFMLITTPQRTMINLAIDAYDWIRVKLPNAFTTAKNKAVEIGGALIKPFKDLLEFIGDILDKIDDIKLPSVDLNPFSRTAGGSLTGGSGSGLTVNNDNSSSQYGPFIFNLNGLLSDDQAASFIQDIMERYGRGSGLTVVAGS